MNTELEYIVNPKSHHDAIHFDRLEGRLPWPVPTSAETAARRAARISGPVVRRLMPKSVAQWEGCQAEFDYADLAAEDTC